MIVMRDVVRGVMVSVIDWEKLRMSRLVMRNDVMKNMMILCVFVLMFLMILVKLMMWILMVLLENFL